MSSLKAIETVYRGYRFRSRLEARWAVFFDSLGIPFEYEIEGFELSAGVGYLPDFLLPAHHIHVEIKPDRELSRTEFEKLILFSETNDLLLIVGSPSKEAMYLLGRRVDPNYWEYVQREHAAGVTHEDQLAVCFEAWEHTRVQFGWAPRGTGPQLVFTALDHATCTRNAILAAQQARFEFGQSGAPG